MATKGDFYQLDIIPSTKLSPAYYKHQIEIKNDNYLVRAGRPIVLIESKTIVMKLKTVLLAGLASVSLSHVRFDHAVGHEGPSRACSIHPGPHRSRQCCLENHPQNRSLSAISDGVSRKSIAPMMPSTGMDGTRNIRASYQVKPPKLQHSLLVY